VLWRGGFWRGIIYVVDVNPYKAPQADAGGDGRRVISSHLPILLLLLVIVLIGTVVIFARLAAFMI